MAASTNRSFEYLEQLPGLTFQKLYQQPSTALAIFRRMLPDLGALNKGSWVNEFLVLIVTISKMSCDGAALYARPSSGGRSRVMDQSRE